MATDDKRREVAARVRDAARAECPLGEIGFTEAMHRALGGSDWRDMTERLADLIDPDCGTGEVDTSRVPERDGTRERLARALGIDLPALLALADCVRGMGEEYDRIGAFGIAVALESISDRIREACGEEGRADGL